MKKRIPLWPLLLAFSLTLACQQAGTGPSGAAASRGLDGSGAFTEGANGPAGSDAAAAAEGDRGGVLGTNPSPEQFQPDAGLKKKDDPNEGEEESGNAGAPLAYSKMAPASKPACGGVLLRWVAWKDDIRVASGQANKTAEEFFKFLQSGDLDPEVTTQGSYRDVCAADASPQSVAEVVYPPAGLHVLFKASGSEMTGLWTKPLASTEELKSLLADGHLIAVGFSEEPAAGDGGNVPPSGTIKIPGKK